MTQLFIDATIVQGITRPSSLIHAHAILQDMQRDLLPAAWRHGSAETLTREQCLAVEQQVGHLLDTSGAGEWYRHHLLVLARYYQQGGGQITDPDFLPIAYRGPTAERTFTVPILNLTLTLHTPLSKGCYLSLTDWCDDDDFLQLEVRPSIEEALTR